MAYRCECGCALDFVAVLDALPRDGSSGSGMVQTRCGGCNTPLELRLSNGRYEVGYSYFGGSMHFEPMKTVRVAGLTVQPSAPDDLDVTLGARHWHFSVDRPSHQRFAVLAAAFARGRRLSSLDFRQWNVTVEAVERNGVRNGADGEWLLEGGDFLHLSGPAPALTRAWHYMNDGINAKR